MPRDASGNYTLPGGWQAITGNTIQAAQHNDPLTDLRTEMTDSLSRSGQGGMLADLDFNTNQVANLGAATLGSHVLDRDALDARYLELAGGTMTGDLQLPTGSSADPSLGLGADDDGLYYGSSAIGFALAGAGVAAVEAAGTSMSWGTTVVTREKGDARYIRSDTDQEFDGDLTGPDGGNAGPTYSFKNSTDTGMWLFAATPSLRFAVGGTKVAQIEDDGTAADNDETIMTRQKGDNRYIRSDVDQEFDGQLAGPDGNDASPTYSFKNSTNTGIRCWSGGPSFVIDVGGTRVARIEDDGTTADNDETIMTRQKGDNRYIRSDTDQSFDGDLTGPDGGNAAPTYSFKNSTNTGMWCWSATPSLCFAVDGTKVAQIQDNGTTAGSDETIITRQKGDNRYLRLSGGTLTGDLEIPAGNAAGPTLLFSGAGQTGLYSWAGGPRVSVALAGVQEAEFADAGDGLPNAVTVVTREKGDDRYIRCDVDSEFDGKLTGPDGNDAAPTYSFKNSTNTGIRCWSGGPSFVIDVGGTKVARIEDDGTTAGNNETIMTRQKGDARYTIDPQNAGWWAMNDATNYTNNTGSTLFLHCRITFTAGGATDAAKFTVKLDGTTVASAIDMTDYHNFLVVVPDGSTARFDDTSTGTATTTCSGRHVYS